MYFIYIHCCEKEKHRKKISEENNISTRRRTVWLTPALISIQILILVRYTQCTAYLLELEREHRRSTEPEYEDKQHKVDREM